MCHYDEIGNNCTVSVYRTIDTMIGSSNYLEGMFLMHDTVTLDKVANGFSAK